MSDEFRAHHCISELQRLLKVQGGQGATEYAEHLLKSRTRFTTTQVNTRTATVHVSEHATKPQEFLQKYEALKLKNVRNLDSLVYLLSNIIDNPILHQTLSKCATERGDATKLIPEVASSVFGSSTVSLPQSGSKLSIHDILELKNSLEKATVSERSSDAFRKVLQVRQHQRKSQSTIPAYPSWMVGAGKKPYLTWDFAFDTSTQHPDVKIGTHSPSRQEAEIVGDLLDVLGGIEGRHILVRKGDDKYGPRKFILQPSLDVSIAEMVKLILPMASSYSIVVSFIEERSMFEYGLINHALCAALKTIIMEYEVSLAQLDSQHRRGEMSLQRLHYVLQPPMRQMAVLADVASAVERGKCIGGAVLSLVHQRIASSVGDKTSQDLCTYLAQHANVPYLEMLEKWIYKGEIDDFYGEFMVEENVKFSKEKLRDEYNDQYWELRYTLCRDRIPTYLEQVAGKILSTGKYLNVVHECGQVVRSRTAREIFYDPIKKEFIHQIEEAHSYASQLLLDLLLDRHQLMQRLRSLKTYFLLNDGDFLLNFMDLTEREMRMPMEEIIPNRLEALLELALRTSMACNDPYKDDLKIVLLPYDVITQLVRILSIDTTEEAVVKSLDPTELSLSGLESFALDYNVRWPLSLVISRKSLTKYQMLFRHLFYCKHVERNLTQIWLKFKRIKRNFLHSKRWYMRSMTILQRMLHFIQNFEYYMMFEVIEPNWQQLEHKLRSAKNVDEVLNFHTDFLRQCLQDCLLTNTELLKMLSKLLMLCVSFASFMQSLSRQVEIREKEALEHSTLAGPPTSVEKKIEIDRLLTTRKETSVHLDEVASTDSHTEAVERFDTNFSTVLMSLLARIVFVSREHGQHRLFNVIYKLDYNGFYRSRMSEDDDDAVKEGIPENQATRSTVPVK